MNTERLLILSLCVCCSACCKTQDDVTVKPLDVDKIFMTAAALSNLYGMNVGNLSMEKSGESAVKNFGQLIAETHNAAQQDLEDIADYFNYQLPSAPDSLHAMQIQLLNQLNGREFDSALVLSQIKEYNELITSYEERIAAGTSGLVATHALKYLPLIRKHLEDAEITKRQIKIND